MHSLLRYPGRTGVLLAALALLAACGEPTSPDGPEVVGTVPTNGGTVQTGSGEVKLDFPSGAVGTSTSITVEPLPPTSVDATVVPGTAFDFGPDGITFAQPVQLTIKYDPAKLPSGTVEGTLALHKQFGAEWRVVQGSAVDLATKRVTAPINGFSVYAVRSLGTPAATISAGDGQSGIAGTAMAVAPSVLVTAGGQPLRGAAVTFAITAGGGSIQHASATTDENGLASAGSWTLGTAAGANTLTATVEGAPVVTFQATGIAACDYAPAYTVGQTEQGTIADTDCEDSSGRRADYRTLTVTEQVALTLTMTSTAMSPSVGVLSATGATVATQYTASTGFTRVVLAPGTYRLVTRGPDAAGRGDYTFVAAVANHDLAACETAARVFMAVGTTSAGTLGDADCPDDVGDPADRVDWFNVWLTAGETYEAKLTAQDAKLSVWGPGATASEIKELSAAPGSATITYKATASGWHSVHPLGRPGMAYQLGITRVSAVDACTIAPGYTVGTRVQGWLSNADCVGSDGRPVDYRTLTVTSTLSAMLTMTGGGYEPLVGITTENGTPVATQYTATPGQSRVVLGPGTYRILTRPVDVASRGWYDLSMTATSHDVEGCGAATSVFMSLGGSASGNLTAGDCTDEYGVPTDRYDAFAVWMKAGSSYRATLEAPEAKFSLWGPNGTATVHHEIASAPGVATITYTPSHDGWHTLYPLGPVGTAYEIAVEQIPLVDACTVAPTYAAGSGVLGMLSEHDCQSQTGGRMDRHTITSTTPLSLTLRLGSDAFTPFVGVEDATGRPIASQYSTSPGFSRVKLAPGTYRVTSRATVPEGRGIYHLQATPDTHAADGCGGDFMVFVTPGVSHAGQVGAADCVDEAGPDPTHHYDGFVMKMIAGTTYTMTFDASAASWVSLWAPDATGAIVFDRWQELSAAGTATLTFTATQTVYHYVYVGGTPGFTYTLDFAASSPSGLRRASSRSDAGAGPLTLVRGGGKPH